MTKTIDLQCVFCKKDLHKEKYNGSYCLIPWRDDPDDPKSSNKQAECTHPKCLRRFIELNFDNVKSILLNLIEKNRN